MGNTLQRDPATDEERNVFFKRAKLIAEAKKLQSRRPSPIIVAPASSKPEGPIRLNKGSPSLSISRSEDNPSPTPAGEEYAKYGKARRSFQYLGADAILQDDGNDFDNHRRRSRHSLTYTDTADAWKLLRGDVDLKDPDEAEAALNVTTIAMGNVNDPDIDPKMLADTVESDDDDDDNEIDIPFRIPPDQIPQAEKFCTVCNIEIPNYPLHPCRVCLKQFHESCYIHSAKQVLSESGLACFRKATTDTGWCCPTCENIWGILKDEEMMDIINEFDRIDINDDAKISRDEYIALRKRKYRQKYDSDMPEDEVQLESLKFDMIDRDKTKEIDWWEFLHYETIKMLRRRRRRSLAKVLTPNEIHQARRVFAEIDVDGDGEVTEMEAQMAFKTWYKRFVEARWDKLVWFEKKVGGQALVSRQVGTFGDDGVKSHHIVEGVNSLLSADKDGSGTVSWMEFLKEQALPIISARLNSPGIVHIEAPSFF